MKQRAAIILAAGMGTRMKSALPKVLHPVGGRAVIDWSIALAQSLGCAPIICVVSPEGGAVKTHVYNALGEDAIAEQSPALGTGHAVSCAKAALAGFDGDVVVLYGDSPLIPKAAIDALFEALGAGASVGVLGFEAAQPGLYGRLVVSKGHDKEAGGLEAIVEAREASPEQLEIKLCNSGVMAASAKTLFALLERVTNENAKGEYYLTDIVGLAREDGMACKAVTCAEEDLIGCDTRADLAVAEATFQAKARSALLENGVTLIAPETVFLSFDTQIAQDVLIEPNVVFAPGVVVETGARIRAFSHIEGASVGTGCEVGPYARLRPGAVLKAGAKIGNFVEVKKTIVGEGAKANHLAYLGDGDIGAGANIGAGTIFCNYDGYFKHKTEIGAGAFIGSNSSLVAPLKIGDNAMVGSGSVVTKNVAADALALSRVEQANKTGWAKKFRAAMSAKKNKKG